MKTARFAINGFGRIGRAAFKIACQKPNVQIVAINDLTNARKLLHLLKHDTAYGFYDKTIYIEQDGVKIETPKWDELETFYTTENSAETYLVLADQKNNILQKVKMLSVKEPLELPWKDLQVDVVIECTGRFVKDGAAKAHVQAGAKAVVVSAPVKGEGQIQTFLKGVNSQSYLGQNVISNASCTTNCISPVMGVLHNQFGILKSAMTTIHAVTSTQGLVDGPPQGSGGDMRKGRSAAFNMVPTSTGAAVATTKVIPDLAGKFDGISVRVPIVTGSISDITALLGTKVTVEQVNTAFIEACQNPLYKDVLSVTHEPLVSSDIVGSAYSAIIDLSMTRVIDGDLVKIFAWYDNEWGYSNRLVEMAQLIAE